MTAFTWRNETFILHPNRVMFWENEGLMILSDLHLGKTGHFRKEGIAVPQDIYKEDLARLMTCIRYFKPKEIIVVGDLFHSKANKEWEWFGHLKQETGSIKFNLVLGNHDKLKEDIIKKLDLRVTNTLEIGKMVFVHNEKDAEAFPENQAGMICGHVHPSILVPAGIRQKIRLPCFHFTPSICTLPAFSLFTGTHAIIPRKSDHIFAIADHQIFKI